MADETVGSEISKGLMHGIDKPRDNLSVFLPGRKTSSTSFQNYNTKVCL